MIVLDNPIAVIVVIACVLGFGGVGLGGCVCNVVDVADGAIAVVVFVFVVFYLSSCRLVLTPCCFCCALDDLEEDEAEAKKYVETVEELRLD